MRVAGEPRGRGTWRGAVAQAAWPLTLARADIDPDSSPGRMAAGSPPWPVQPGPAQLRLDFVVSHWVDIDTLAQTTLAGLRDAGWYGRGLSGLRALLATKTAEGEPGVTIAGAKVDRLSAPGTTALEVFHEVVPRDRTAVRRWSQVLARAWGDRAHLDDRSSWIDVALGGGGRGSLLGRLEPILDALEPVLGRDPRGRTELFPNDHLVTWLRVRRGAADQPLLQLRLGPCDDA